MLSLDIAENEKSAPFSLNEDVSISPNSSELSLSEDIIAVAVVVLSLCKTLARDIIALDVSATWLLEVTGKRYNKGCCYLTFIVNPHYLNPVGTLLSHKIIAGICATWLVGDIMVADIGVKWLAGDTMVAGVCAKWLAGVIFVAGAGDIWLAADIGVTWLAADIIVAGVSVTWLVADIIVAGSWIVGCTYIMAVWSQFTIVFNENLP